MLTILPLSEAAISLYNQIDNRYLVGELAAVRVTRSGFSLEYMPLNKAEWHTYPPESLFSPAELLRRKDAICFFAFLDNQPVGQAITARHWNNLAMLWDIRVDVRSRRKGVGKALLDACRSWAQHQGLKGIMVETQDSNPAACQFYQSSGFLLGGVDRMLYAAIPEQSAKPPKLRDSALFFYQLFD
jgi:streptothricin acetyltransferase